jgi:protein ImuB
VGADPDTAAAVVVKNQIVACSFAARAEGVRRGQRTRDAQRLAPGLVLHARDEAAEARAFEPVLAVLADFTPRFEVVRPGLAALPMDGPARYFGGEDLVVRAIRDRVGEAGVGAGVGVADGVFAATLAARTDTRVVPGRTAEFLAAFPTAVLDLPGLVEPLARLGVHTLGRLAELPADAVAGRFGADGVMAHRLARGLDARPPAPLRQGPDLSVEAVFEPPADGSERIVFAAKALADEFHAVLAQSGVACVRVAVELHGAAGPGAEPEVSHRLWRHEGLLSSTAVAERVR